MIVETATLADLPAILVLEENFEVRWSEQSWRDELTGDGRLVLIARRRSGKVAGVACFQLVDDVADLHRIVVASEQRRLGFARVMVMSGLQWALTNGAQRMLLEVDHRNEAAIALYRGYGFRQVAVRRDYYGPGADALILERGLQGVDVDSIGIYDQEDGHE